MNLTIVKSHFVAENHMDDLFASMTTGLKKGQKAKGTSIGQLPYIRLTNKADYHSNLKVTYIPLLLCFIRNLFYGLALVK